MRGAYYIQTSIKISDRIYTPLYVDEKEQTPTLEKLAHHKDAY